MVPSEGGVLLKAWRTKRKLSQGQLGKLIELSQETISRLENGEDSLSLAGAVRIEKLTGIEPSAFLRRAKKSA